MKMRKELLRTGKLGDAPDLTAHAQLIERLFREHNEALLRFLQSRLHSAQDAREVAQEAYVRLLSLHSPGAVSYLRAFLFQTAANLALDRLRRGQVHNRATAQPMFTEFVDNCTPERCVAGTQELERLQLGSASATAEMSGEHSCSIVFMAWTSMPSPKKWG